ncbi:MAG: nuclear transport factor 2 family protein [Pyrinomonadaceae bacterium]
MFCFRPLLRAPFFAFIFIGFYFFASVQTNSAQAELQKVFAAAKAAVGAEQDIRQIRSIEAFAECTGPKGRYTTLIRSFGSNKTYFTQSFEYKDEDSEVFINDSLAWRRSAGSPGFAIVSPFERLVVNLHEFQRMAFDFENMFTGFQFAGEEDFENRRSLKVKAKNALGGDIFLFFDRETSRLSGYILPVPNSGETVKNVFADWKRAGKLELPSTVVATDSAGEWTLKFSRIDVNTADEKILDVPSEVKDLAELLRLHKEHQTAHLTYNAELFLESFADNVTQIQRGQVRTQDKAANLARFKNYFASYKFKEWEDVKPPVIRISKDGTLATIIVEKRVSGTFKNEKGEEESDLTEFAWLEVWEKINGKWKVVTIASTTKPAK